MFLNIIWYTYNMPQMFWNISLYPHVTGKLIFYILYTVSLLKLYEIGVNVFPVFLVLNIIWYAQLEDEFCLSQCQSHGLKFYSSFVFAQLTVLMVLTHNTHVGVQTH